MRGLGQLPQQLLHMPLACSTALALTPPERRSLWRTRGLAPWPLFACCLCDAEDALRARVPTTVACLGEKRTTKLSPEDRDVVLAAADFVTGFVAEEPPVEVVMTDARPVLPGVASALAVQDVNGEKEFLGSPQVRALVQTILSAHIEICWRD